MKAKERLYSWLNQATFNEDDGCRHPQDVIAAAIGCTERTVIRCTKELEREGRLTVERPRRRGQCNTYHVAVWNPSKRSGVLNVLEVVRPFVRQRREQKERAEQARLARRRNAECHPKRTAKPSRAQTPPTLPARCLLKNQRGWSRAKKPGICVANVSNRKKTPMSKRSRLSQRMTDTLRHIEENPGVPMSDLLVAGFAMNTVYALEIRELIDFKPTGKKWAGGEAWGFFPADGTRPADYKTNKQRWMEHIAAQRAEIPARRSKKPS